MMRILKTKKQDSSCSLSSNQASPQKVLRKREIKGAGKIQKFKIKQNEGANSLDADKNYKNINIL